MADRINIPSVLTIEQIKGIEKFQAQLSAATASAFKSVNINKAIGLSTDTGVKIVKIEDHVLSLGRALAKLKGAGGNKLFTNITDGLDGLVRKVTLNSVRVEAALSRLDKIALTGSSQKLKKAFEKYKTVFGNQTFDGQNFTQLVAGRFESLAERQTSLLNQAATKNIKAKQKEADGISKASKTVVAAYDAVIEAEYNRQSQASTNVRAGRGLPQFLDRDKELRERREQLAAKQREINSDNSSRVVADRLNTERIVRADIAASEAASAKQRANLEAENRLQTALDLELEKETLRVKAQQVAVQKEINKAEASGVAQNSRYLKDARQFAKTDARQIAMSRGAGQGRGNINAVFSDDYFKNLKEGLRGQEIVARSFNQSSFSARRFGEATALAFKRYSAFVLGTFALQKAFSIFGNATQQVIDFDKNLTKLRQVTGGTADEIEKLGGSIFASAKKTGSGINDISEGLLIFAQAGFDSTEQLKRVSTILSQLPLTPSFDNIKSTADGLVAVFGQFGLGLSDTESILDRFNYVAKETAIESQDLIDAASKSGSSFAAAGADLNKFIELTTLLRSKTRESASVISTFFRTTLTKLQGAGSQDFLESVFGPEIRDLTVIQQLDKLAEKYASLNSNNRNNLLAPIVDVRQLSRFGKLLEEINNEAIRKQTGQKTVFDLIGESSGSVSKDAKLAGDNLSTSFGRITAAFAEVLETLQRDTIIKRFVSGLADITVGLASVIKNSKALLAILSTVGALTVFPKIAEFNRGFLNSFNNRALVSRLAQQRGTTEDAVTASLPSGAFGTFGGLNRRRFARSLRNFGRSIPAPAAFAASAFAATGAFSLGGDKPNRGQNLFNNALQGGAIGGLAGNAFGPWGIAIGGLTGATIGLIQAMKENTKAKLDEKAAQFTRQIDSGDPTQFLKVLRLASSSTLRTVTKNFYDRRVGESFEVTRTIGRSASEGLRSFVDESPENAKNLVRLFKEQESQIINQIVANGNGDLTSIRDSAITNLFKRIGVEDVSKEQSDALRQILSEFTASGTLDTLSQLEKRIQAGRETQRQKPLSDFFENLGFGIDRTIQSLRDFTENLAASADISRKFDTIITDFSTLILPSLASSDKVLLQQNGVQGLDVLTDVFNKNFAKIAGNREISTAVADALQKGFGNTEESAQVATVQEFLSQFTESSRADASNAFTAIQGLLGPTAGLQDVLQFVNSFGNDTRAAAEEITRVTDANALQAGIIRANADALSAELTARQNLNAVLLESSNQIYEVTQNIRSVREEGLDRRISQNAFVNEESVGLTNRRRADEFLRRSGLSNSPDVSGLIIGANRQRLSDAAAAAEASRSGNLGDTEVFRRSQRSQSSFENVQQLFNQGLEELRQRLSNAASAADTLQDVFGTLRATVISAGEGVRQFTKRDFAVALSDIRKFGSATSGSFDNRSLNKGFASLGPGGLDRVTKLLGLTGDFDLGNGLTGNQLNDKINAAFGAPAIASVISSLTGQKVSSGDIENRLQASFQEQRNAAKLEQQLRQQLINSLDIQRKVLEDSRNALNEQTQVLNALANDPNGLKALADIREKTSQLFTDTAQKVAMDLTPVERPPLPAFKNSVGNEFLTNQVNHSVAVEPMLVNVKVFSDGILEILGPELQKSIEVAISDKLSAVFADDPEKASKLQQTKPTRGRQYSPYDGG